MLDLIESVSTAWQRGERAFLATVVNVEGSAYRHEGARLLVLEDGSYQGMISGGCLEPEIAETTARCGLDLPIYRRFDLRDDSVFGLGMGCGGMVGVFIEEVHNQPEWRSWIDTFRENRPVVRALVYESLRNDVSIGRFLVIGLEGTAGSTGDVDLDRKIAEKSLELLQEGTGQARDLEVDSVRLLLDISQPSPRLVVFGAGDDAVPVVRLARMAGFSVSVVDARSGLVTPERFPETRLLILPPEEYEEVLLGPTSHVVIMHHHVAKDAVALRQALAKECSYIGLLGPRHRFEKVWELLGKDGSLPSDEALARIDTPIGLEIGADGPEEIALSIVAKLVAVRRSRLRVPGSESRAKKVRGA